MINAAYLRWKHANDKPDPPPPKFELKPRTSKEVFFGLIKMADIVRKQFQMHRELEELYSQSFKVLLDLIAREAKFWRE